MEIQSKIENFKKSEMQNKRNIANQTTKFYVRNIRWIAIIALGLSVFLSALDATIVALALPPIANYFQLSDSISADILLAYAIPLTLMIIPSDVLIKKFQSLTLFLVSIIGFGFGSIICGLAPTFDILLIGRIIQGSFAAVISTQAFALAAVVVSPEERGKAMGIIGMIAPLGGIVGPAIGGLLLANFGWQSIFFVNIPIVIIAILLGLFSLHGVNIIQQNAKNVYSRIMDLLREPKFLFSLLAFFFSVSSAVTLYYLLPFDLSRIQLTSSIASGLIFLTVPLGMMIMGLLGGYLTDRYKPRPFILIGSSLLLVGTIILSFIATTKTFELEMALLLLLIGMGIGLFTSPVQTVIMGFGGRELIGTASVLSNLSARVATILGPLVMGVTWYLIVGFQAQIVYGLIIVDFLAFATVFFAFFSTTLTKTGKSLIQI